jgi:hypothetical protein
MAAALGSVLASKSREVLLTEWSSLARAGFGPHSDDPVYQVESVDSLSVNRHHSRISQGEQVISTAAIVLNCFANS